MTYKKIVERMVEEEARRFVENALDVNGYDNAFVFVDSVDFEHSKASDLFYFTVCVDVRFKYDIAPHHIEVGGTVDDSCGICASVIWNKKHDALWMSVPETRKTLGIETFDIMAA